MLFSEGCWSWFGLVLFSEGCWSWSLGWCSVVRGVGLGVYNSTVLCKSVCRYLVFHLRLFLLHFSCHISFCLIILCISVLVLYHFEVEFQHDPFVSFVISVCASFSQFCSAPYTLLSLSLTCLPSFSTLSFHLLVIQFLDALLTVQVVPPWSYQLIYLLLLS